MAFINEHEAVRRIKQRDNKSREEAEQRIRSQMTNVERISQANVVFCSQWPEAYTQSQVDKAWSTLLEKIRD